MNSAQSRLREVTQELDSLTTRQTGMDAEVVLSKTRLEEVHSNQEFIQEFISKLSDTVALLETGSNKMNISTNHSSGAAFITELKERENHIIQQSKDAIQDAEKKYKALKETEKRCEDSFSVAQLQLADLELDIQAKEVQLHLLQDSISHKSNLLSPIRLVPPSIWLEIFKFVATGLLKSDQFQEEGFYSPIHSTSCVCQKWRNIAYNTPSLWREIRFFGGEIGKGRIFYAQFLLKRAGGALDYLLMDHSGVNFSIEDFHQACEGLFRVSIVEATITQATAPTIIEAINSFLGIKGVTIWNIDAKPDFRRVVLSLLQPESLQYVEGNGIKKDIRLMSPQPTTSICLGYRTLWLGPLP
ncbi:hypothetical protein FRB91_004300 [Serendipita sp. 411]|nr:hypothetical protein FRB91_004300 [Serendipita sp. 411]